MPMIPENDPQVPRRRFLVESFGHMKKSDWISQEMPNWWIRIGIGKVFRFIQYLPITPGNKELKVELDLDQHMIPGGETIYFGAGYGTKGIRGEYPMRINKKLLAWWPKPLMRQAYTCDEKNPQWITKCGRYSIYRCSIQKDFTALYGHRILGRFKNLEKALEAVNEENVRICKGLCLKTYNLKEVLEIAESLGDLHLPPKDTSICPRCKSAESWSPELGICLDCEDKPKKEKVKKEQDPKKGKVGIVQAIVDILKTASKQHPLTIKDILDKMTVRFPERDSNSMLKTIKAQVGYMLPAKGILIKHDGKPKDRRGYWIFKGKK